MTTPATCIVCARPLNDTGFCRHCGHQHPVTRPQAKQSKKPDTPPAKS